MTQPKPLLDAAAVSRIIEMAWDDRTPFEAIHTQFELDEAAVKTLMRQQLKAGSYRLWRQRVRGRKAKHAKHAKHAQLPKDARLTDQLLVSTAQKPPGR
jgi:uncharacterized protein (TIGR03643 family)